MTATAQHTGNVTPMPVSTTPDPFIGDEALRPFGSAPLFYGSLTVSEGGFATLEPATSLL